MRRLAIDIGAESGRAVLGELKHGSLVLTEVHRFANVPVRSNGSLLWDLELLEKGVLDCVAAAGANLDSVGIDTWAVDFVLVGKQGKPLGPPFHYRDGRTDHVMEKAFAQVESEEIYEATGVQFLQFNTLYQLYSMVLTHSPVLLEAERLLTVPDYLTTVLAGGDLLEGRCEFTNATTTQCFDPRTGDWAWSLLERLDIPTKIFPPLIQPGTQVGIIPGSSVKVIAPACHDTASAVAAIPAAGEDFAWISSGTWSIMGIETPSPIINDRTFRAGFTNEGSIGCRFRFCKNVMGLWILQQCRAQWEREGIALSYADLVVQAEAARGGFTPIDPDDAVFLKPGDMPSRVKSWLEDRNRLIPNDPGEIARLVIESLANRYKEIFDQLRILSGRNLSRIHVVGGGSQNDLLNRLTSELCEVPVVSGPVEATAIGNILAQMLSTGEIESLAEGRKLPICRSTGLL